MENILNIFFFIIIYSFCISEEETAISGNSHLMNDSTAKLHKDAPAPEIVPAKQEGSSRKEQSVLQTKLTKLAIQIGYAGNYDCLFTLY